MSANTLDKKQRRRQKKQKKQREQTINDVQPKDQDTKPKEEKEETKRKSLEEARALFLVKKCTSINQRRPAAVRVENMVVNCLLFRLLDLTTHPSHWKEIDFHIVVNR